MSEENRSTIADLHSKSNLLVICLANFTVISGFAIISPFFPIYINDILHTWSFWGISIGIAAQLGFLMAGYTLTRFLTGPAFGSLSDTNPGGRKYLIVIGQFLFAFLMLAYGIAMDFWSLFFIRIGQGMASSSVWPVGQAMIIDSAPPEKRGKYLGYFAFSLYAGLAIGPFIGFGMFYLLNTSGGLSDIPALRITFYFVGILCVFVAFSTMRFLKDPRFSKSKISHDKEFLTHRRRIRENLILYFDSAKRMAIATIKSPKILYNSINNHQKYRTKTNYIMYLVAICYGVAFAAVVPLVSLILEEHYFLSPAPIALIFGFIGIISMFGAPIGGFLSDKWGQKRSLLFSGTICVVSLILITFDTILGLTLAIIWFSLQRFTLAAFQPSIDALVSEIVPKENRGKEFGLMQASFNIGGVIGPIIGGILYDHFNKVIIVFHPSIKFVGLGIPFIMASVLMVIAVILIQSFINLEDPMRNKK